MMKNFFIKSLLISYFLVLAACVEMSPEERDIYMLLGEKVNLEMFDKVYSKDVEIKLDEIFRNTTFFPLSI